MSDYRTLEPGQWDTKGQLTFEADGIAWDCRACPPGVVASLTLPIERQKRRAAYVLEVVVDDAVLATSAPVVVAGGMRRYRFVFEPPFAHRQQLLGLRLRNLTDGCAVTIDTVTTRTGEVVDLRGQP